MNTESPACENPEALLVNTHGSAFEHLRLCLRAPGDYACEHPEAVLVNAQGSDCEIVNTDGSACEQLEALLVNTHGSTCEHPRFRG